MILIIEHSDQEIVALSKAITEVSKILGISAENGKGYRALTNLDDHGGQEVPHLTLSFIWRRKNWKNG